MAGIAAIAGQPGLATALGVGSKLFDKATELAKESREDRDARLDEINAPAVASLDEIVGITGLAPDEIEFEDFTIGPEAPDIDSIEGIGEVEESIAKFPPLRFIGSPDG